MVSNAAALQPGDRVEVVWGRETVTGHVAAVRTAGNRTHVLVAIDVLGPDGSALDVQTVSVPLNAVRVLAY